MLAEAAASIAGIKGAMDIVKGAHSLATSVEMNSFKAGLLEKLVDTQVALFELNERLMALQSENHELRTQLAQSSAWEEMASGYQLVNTGQGTKAWHPINSQAGPESGDWACPTCWEERRKSLLITDAGRYRGSLTCPTCKWHVTTYSRQIPPPRNDRGDGWGY